MLGVLGLGGCESAGDATGAVAGITSGAGSANPVVGTAVALGTKAAVDALVLYLARSQQHAEQDAIAQTAGAAAPWQIHHFIPFSDEHGTLLVAGLVQNPLTACKEVVFTMDAGKQQAHYVTTACLDDGTWHWAAAEPTTRRWGFLQ